MRNNAEHFDSKGFFIFDFVIVFSRRAKSAQMRRFFSLASTDMLHAAYRFRPSFASPFARWVQIFFGRAKTRQVTSASTDMLHAAYRFRPSFASLFF